MKYRERERETKRERKVDKYLFWREREIKRGMRKKWGKGGRKRERERKDLPTTCLFHLGYTYWNLCETS